MAIMAGMLPGVECARRRRLRLRKGESSSGAAAEAPRGTRRASSPCLYAGGHEHARLLGSSSSSAASKGTARAWTWTLDSNAREAKERLDQKLRGQRQREPVAKSKRHQSTGAEGGGGSLQHPAAAAAGGATPTPCPCALRREVFSEPPNAGGGAARRRFSWARLRLGRCRRAQAEAGACECAVCLEELRAGDVVARLPCAHRFHWACAVPWVQAASRCPVCRARAHLVASPPTEIGRRCTGDRDAAVQWMN